VNYYKRHIGDYAKKAGHLSVMEHGVYTLLLDAYYDREQPPTRAEALRQARARSPEEIAAVDAVLADFFVLEGDRYTQRRVEEEFIKAEQVASMNALKGKMGGRPRKPKGKPEKSRRVSDGKPNESPEKPNPLIHQSTNQEQEQKLTSTPAGANQCRLGFDDFWSAYPSKDGKKPARLKWEKKKLDRIAGRIVDDVLRRSREHGKWLDGYIPNATTYLNQERWNDPIQPRSGAPPPPHAPSKTRQAISDILGVTEHEQSPEYQQLTASLV
jgi:uncharacterized protein YdaU (DUF1376 family)